MNTTICGAAAAICAQVTRTDGVPGQPSTASAPATCSISGTQWPPLNGGSPHSRANTRGRSSPATAAWMLASRSRSPATTWWARCSALAALPTWSTPSRTSSRELVQGDDLSPAAEDVQGLVDVAGGDRADRAQVPGPGPGRGVPDLRQVPGFRGARLLRRTVGAETEFVSLTFFEGLDAIRSFAGSDYKPPSSPTKPAWYLSGLMRVCHYQTAVEA